MVETAGDLLPPTWTASSCTRGFHTECKVSVVSISRDMPLCSGWSNLVFFLSFLPSSFPFFKYVSWFYISYRFSIGFWRRIFFFHPHFILKWCMLKYKFLISMNSSYFKLFTLKKKIKAYSGYPEVSNYCIYSKANWNSQFVFIQSWHFWITSGLYEHFPVCSNFPPFFPKFSFYFQY